MATDGSAPLARTRVLIDAVDDVLLLAFALRRQLARGAARCKRAAGLPMVDPERERRVRVRAARRGLRMGVPVATAHALMDVAIADARCSQDLAPDLDQGGGAACPGIIAPAMHADFADPRPAGSQPADSRPDAFGPADFRSDDFGSDDSGPAASRWLRLLPPPTRWAPLLRACPPAWQRRALEHAMARTLDAALRADALAFLQGRRLGIEVTDLALRWTVTFDGGRLRALDAPAEACVRGTATDLLLLAGRLEDADTLFFQRRLILTGDTELGLTARNLLDRLPWEEVPLGLRIALNRGARLAQAAREVHRRPRGAIHAKN